jgi:hypothetical protein
VTSGALVPSIKILLQDSLEPHTTKDLPSIQRTMGLVRVLRALQKHPAAKSALLGQFLQLLAAPAQWVKLQRHTVLSGGTDAGGPSCIPLLGSSLLQELAPEMQAEHATAVAESCSPVQLLLLPASYFFLLSGEQQVSCCRRVKVRFGAINY